MITLDNGILQVSCRLDSGTWTARRGGHAFLAEGRLHDAAAPPSAVRVGPIRCGLGTGKAVELAWADGPIRRLILFESLPFVCIQAAFRNPRDEAATITTDTVLRAAVDLGEGAERFRGFDPGGVYSFRSGEKKTSSCFAAAVEPTSRRGIVLGWVSHRRASGVITLERGESGWLETEAGSEFGHLEVPSQALVEGETVAVGWFDDALDGLEAFAEACARSHDVKLPPCVPSGDCSVKIDGLWEDMAIKVLHPSPDYRPGASGEAVRHDPRATQIEAYRLELERVRDASGPEAFLLGCNHAQDARVLAASIGLVDGMRIGHHIGADWDAVRGCAAAASRSYFFHGKTWYNVPDCLMFRGPLTLDQARAWASLIALSGQVNMLSERLPELPQERLDILRRTLPSHGGPGRPLDLFQHELPQVWHYCGQRAGETVDLVGLFNWTDEPATVGWVSDPTLLSVPLSPANFTERGSMEGDAEERKVGSETQTTEIVGFDFWENQFLPPQRGPLRFELRPGSCRVVALSRPAQPERPQLVGSSHHVTQGILDVRQLAWDPETGTLLGCSDVSADDPYELRIHAPQGSRRWTAGEPTVSSADQAAGVRITCRQAGAEVRVEIRSPAARTVEWNVPFAAVEG